MTYYCRYKFTKGKRKGKHCEHFANYDNYCGLHKKIIDKRVGRSLKAKSDLDDFLNGDVQKQIPKKNKKSVFLLSINTNKTVAKMTEEDKVNFKIVAKYLFDDHGVFDDFVIKRYGREKPESDLIVDQMSDFNYEISPETQRLHLHGVIDIEHKSNLLIDLPALREYVNETMGYKLNVNLKVEKTNSLTNFIDYSNKSIPF